jgi:septal ring factor EnvC (AmiA/AmiB activator)
MTQNMYILVCTLSAVAVFLFGYWLCSVEKGMEIKHIREDDEQQKKRLNEQIEKINSWYNEAVEFQEQLLADIHVWRTENESLKRQIELLKNPPEVIGEAITDYWTAEGEFIDRREMGTGC